MLPPSNRSDRVFKAFVLLSLTALLILYSTHRPPKLAYVESGRLLEDYLGMVDAKRTYHLQRQEWQRNLDTLRSETERAAAAYQRDRTKLNTTQRQEAETRLRLKQDQFYQYRQVIGESDQKEQQRFSQQVIDSTNKFIKYYGKHNNYDIILLTSEGDNIAFAKDFYDITVPVIKELNARYSAARKKEATNEGKSPAK